MTAASVSTTADIVALSAAGSLAPYPGMFHA
jgi:hypothetical protein